MTPLKAELLPIVVVDDDSDAAEMTVEYLGAYGFLCTFFSSSTEALFFLAQNPARLLISDIIMPEISGIELAGKVRSLDSRNASIPIILMSAMDADEYKVSGLSVADDYLTKPFSLPELHARVKSHLRIHELQADLAESVERYRSLYDSVPALCVTLDDQLHITEANALFCARFGNDCDQIIGSPFVDIFTLESHGPVRSFFESALSDRVLRSLGHFSLNMLDEAEEPVCVTMQVIRMSGCVAPFIVTMTDVTGRLRLERQQKLARQQMYRSARLASVGTLASGAAHELNNPLAAILGFSESMLMRFDAHEAISSEEVKNSFHIIFEQSLRCRDIIDRLMTFAHDPGTEIKTLSLRDAALSAVKIIEKQFIRAGILLDVDIPEFSIRAHDRKLSQALLNILTNCLDFCSKGAHVSVSVVRKPLGVELVVSDTGPGIEDKVLSKIFDPFFTTKDVGQGFGLGLSTAHKLIEECGGSITVSSESEIGTTVIITLQTI